MIFLGRNHINVIRVIKLSQEDGDVPEGGGWGECSGNGKGYDMTLHTNNGKPVCISFCFIIFYSQRGDRPPPSNAPEGGGGVIFFSYRKRGMA